MLMEKTHYLPDEILKESNYPEVGKVKEELDSLQSFAMKLHSAVALYNEARKEKVEISIDELKKNITVCRKICEVLGKAEKPCFDLLIDLRKTQEAFHEILFAYNRFGSQYVKDPTKDSMNQVVDGGGVI